MAQFEINWQNSDLGTAAYAIYQIANGNAAKLELNPDSVSQLLERAKAGNLNPAQIIDEMIASDFQIEDEAIRKSVSDEVGTRGRLMMEQWNARGPGLVFALINQIPELFASEPHAVSFDVILALPQDDQPAGWLADSNRAVVAAMLYDSNPELPELMRVTHLWARNTARTKLGLPKSSQFLICCAALLLAADYVDLTPLNSKTLALAADLWSDGMVFEADELGELKQLMDFSAKPEQFKTHLLKWIRDRNGFKEKSAT